MPTAATGSRHRVRDRFPGAFFKLAWSLLTAIALADPSLAAQTVLSNLDLSGPVGQRPYEMVWAQRQEPAPPSIRFDRLDGWRLRVYHGAQAILQPSRAETLWGRPVGRLRYRGNGHAAADPKIRLILSHPITVQSNATAVDFWVYGNRWAWENPPGTPPVDLLFVVRDARGREQSIEVGRVRWKSWWLMHRKLPPSIPLPAEFTAIEIAGGWQKDWRTIFFDSIRFYHEVLAPLHFRPRPRRPLHLLPGQSPGANKGPGLLPFPTREQTILPTNFSRAYTNRVVSNGPSAYDFVYRDSHTRLVYHFRPREGPDGIRAELNGHPAGRLLEGAALRVSGKNAPWQLTSSRADGSVVKAVYQDGTRLRIRMWQKSLVIDVINRSRKVSELDLGRVAEVQDPRLLDIPYLTYGSSAPCVLMTQVNHAPVFVSVWMDPYRSDGSVLFSVTHAGPHSARINGGVKYQRLTNGRRNPLFERLFLTVSPTFQEALPTIPNPVGLHAALAKDRLWQESWGPGNYQNEERRGERLRAYGIQKLIQCNHEITWRDGGESFTLRTRAAPKKGGDPALERYVAHQKKLGWLSGLYGNYTDFAPVNAFWDPDAVQRTPDGNWRGAWPRCWALKPLRAVEFEHLLAPRIKSKFKPNAAYTDVQTAVAPWAYNDFDARVPGAGTFAQTLYAYGELLRNESKVYGGPVFSEGTYQWLYAGLDDGNYGLAYDHRPPIQQPFLPLFDLFQIHPRECDIGMGWTAHFCEAMPGWQKPENLDHAIDRFLLYTLAYGHIGWLVEEKYGIDRTCRSYYMLQQVQARYGLKAPTRVMYWDGKGWCNPSQALARNLPQNRRQMRVDYPGGPQLWLNDHPKDNWDVHWPDRSLVLPPTGWAIRQTNGDLISYSALGPSGRRVDYLRSASVTFQDGRHHRFSTPAADFNGAVAISPAGKDRLKVIRIYGKGPLTIGRPYHMPKYFLGCTVSDVHGTPLPSPSAQDTPGEETRVDLPTNAVACFLRFGDQP